MPADAPTILATSGGIGAGRRTRFTFTALTDLAVDLSGVSGGPPRVCVVATAMGDDKAVVHYLTEAAQERGFAVSHLSLFRMPNVDDITAHLLDQDVVWVFGGSVASAGSICWHAGGTTDSFGPDLQPVTDGLGFVPYANGVHYDSEKQRRPLLHSLVGDDVLQAAYATDDGAGVLYHGTEFAESVAEIHSAEAYFAEAQDGAEIETPLDVRRL